MRNPSNDLWADGAGDDLWVFLTRLMEREGPALAAYVGAASGLETLAELRRAMSGLEGRAALHWIDADLERPAPAFMHDGVSTPVVRHRGLAASLDALPSIDNIAQHYGVQGRRDLADLLDRFAAETQALRGRAAETDLLGKVKSAYGVEAFDLVVLDGSPYTAAAELDGAIGARWIVVAGLDDYGGAEARRRLIANTEYDFIYDQAGQDRRFAVFRRRHRSPLEPLPIHFFTIVLNGEPFIRYHEEVFRELPVDWTWHIVEGVAALKHDTAWSVGNGAFIPDAFHDRGRSNDGTSAYLDELQARWPDRVFIHRKPLGEFWDGKREMVNAPLPHLNRPGLLWQLDVDELWTRRQILDVHAAFKAEPDRTAAYFWCEYFVGPKRIISTRFNYAQNPRQEWQRVWRFRPGMIWAAHEPPTLKERRPDGTMLDVAAVNPFDQDETEAMGAVFQHYAYVLEPQLAFKEDYYGYKGGVKAWKRLQSAEQESVFLRDHLAWVTDDTLARYCPPKLEAERLVEFNAKGDFLRFRFDRALNKTAPAPVAPTGKIVVDGVFFQELNSGIARVWINLLTRWAERAFGKSIVFLDRAGSAPRIAGIVTRTVPAYDAARPEADRLLLQRICDEEGAELFVSTYYTTPLTTPSVFFGHDMIPERLGAPMHTEQSWRNKHLAIAHASASIMVSKNSARDLIELGPVRPGSPVHVAYNGCPAAFHPAAPDERSAFRAAHGLTGDYLLYLGERRGFHNYKNALLLFRALARWPSARDMTVVLVGGNEAIEPELAALAPETRVLRLSLDDDGLRAAYSEAYAFVYPSRYEGFGIPVLEAMACGAPVVACRNSSIPEVAGEAAALLDSADDPQAMAEALEWLRDPAVRQRLTVAGLAQVKQFSFERMAREVEAILTDSLAELRDGRLARPEAHGLKDLIGARATDRVGA